MPCRKHAAAAAAVSTFARLISRCQGVLLSCPHGLSCLAPAWTALLTTQVPSPKSCDHGLGAPVQWCLHLSCLVSALWLLHLFLHLPARHPAAVHRRPRALRLLLHTAGIPTCSSTLAQVSLQEFMHSADVMRHRHYCLAFCYMQVNLCGCRLIVICTATAQAVCGWCG